MLLSYSISSDSTLTSLNLVLFRSSTLVLFGNDMTLGTFSFYSKGLGMVGNSLFMPTNSVGDGFSLDRPVVVPFVLKLMLIGRSNRNVIVNHYLGLRFLRHCVGKSTESYVAFLGPWSVEVNYGVGYTTG